MHTVQWGWALALLLPCAGCARDGNGPPDPPLPPGTRVGFYAAPNGSSTATGSGTDPWDLQTALQGGNGQIQPGDTLWLRNGTYFGPVTSTLAGTSGSPIVVRGYPGERPIINGRDVSGSSEILTVDGTYTHFRDFEITNTALDRTTGRHSGVYLRNGTNIKLINLLIHDTGMGVYAEQETAGCEIYGLVIYNGGWQTATRSNGHALYLKQDGSGSKLVRDNVMFNSFGLSVHLYTDAGTGALQNFTIRGNVAFNSGTLSIYNSSNILVGGEEVADNITVDSNLTYHSPGVASTNLRLGYLDVVNGDVVARNNYVVGGTPLLETGYWTTVDVSNNTLGGTDRTVRVREADLTGYTWGGNQFYRDPTATAWQYNGTNYTFANFQSTTSLAATDQATGTNPAAAQVFVRPNVYEAGRATIVVYNWGGAGSAAVSLAGVLSAGQQYEIRHVYDLLGMPVASGTYGGGTVNVPLGTKNPPAPIGGSPVAPIKAGPAFDVFIVRRVG